MFCDVWWNWGRVGKDEVVGNEGERVAEKKGRKKEEKSMERR